MDVASCPVLRVYLAFRGPKRATRDHGAPADPTRTLFATQAVRGCTPQTRELAASTILVVQNCLSCEHARPATRVRRHIALPTDSSCPVPRVHLAFRGPKRATRGIPGWGFPPKSADLGRNCCFTKEQNPQGTPEGCVGIQRSVQPDLVFSSMLNTGMDIWSVETQSAIQPAQFASAHSCSLGSFGLALRSDDAEMLRARMSLVVGVTSPRPGES